MLTGMYVQWKGDTWQVATITAPAPSYAGLPRPASVYGLAPVGGGPWVYVSDPLAVDMPLTPACGVCELPAGYGACAATGVHREPVPLSVAVGEVGERLARDLSESESLDRFLAAR